MNTAPQPNVIETAYVSWVVEELRREVVRRERLGQARERRLHRRACFIAGLWVISVAAMYVLAW